MYLFAKVFFTVCVGLQLLLDDSIEASDGYAIGVGFALCVVWFDFVLIRAFHKLKSVFLDRSR
jgi:hypothetical protein